VDPLRADGEARPLRVARLFAWQAAIAAGLAAGAAGTGRGSAAGIVLGAGLFAASFALQAWATRAALGSSARPVWAVAIFTLKLGFLVAVGAWVLSTAAIPPLSFAAGATTLLLAIVAETCYRDWSARRRVG